MKLYETLPAIEELWSQVEDILTGDRTEGTDGLPVNADTALDWIEEALSRIEDERDRKALNIAALIKNFRAQAEALKTEKMRLQRRQQAAEKTVERLTQYLGDFLPDGLKLSDARSVIGWRKSESINCWSDPGLLPVEFQRMKVEADLTAIKTALKAGQEVAGAELQIKQNIQIR
ncbi:siphovirus Gp157 family protein [Ruficoccus sp. ZRK36]|uniref:siphovirus Gp157 family protein n=1 Tax=Ruficoccus sp. ZRK36 TaxID=2866311 RepID=UPI001C73A375|nr:siphovirus Gp157 family protein [Ruficoccus sp. ZRK36]QYY34576.1 siphovirus Gp157 family protein [Ruficoccus sp. ZRK36]